MQRSRTLALALTLSLCACLEVEEEVEVRPDGSLLVSVSAKGDPQDLAQGHPLPTSSPWRAADAATLAWLSGAEPKKDEPLRLEAGFASAADLPRFFAPASEPYQSAHLERSTRLSIERKGTRTIYSFERTYPARRHEAWTPAERIEAGLPEETRKALDDEVPLSPQALDQAIGVVRDAYAETAGTVARSALGAVYLEGDALLSVDAFERILAAVEGSVRATISDPLIRRLYATLLAAKDQEHFELPPEFDLVRLARETTRASLPAGLEAEGVPAPVRNAVLERLEWTFTAIDQTTDLGDEKLSLALSLPGRIVDGNFDALEDGRARWTRAGGDLKTGDLVLRAVSVLE